MFRPDDQRRRMSKDAPSDTPGLDVTEDVSVTAQEQDAVAGWIRAVPFQLVMGDLDFRSDVDVRPAARFVRPVIGNGRVGLAVPDMDLVGPVSVGLAAARRIGNVR